ncbi:2'-5' RNA ligase family protein [Clostridium felsineum]|nr:2'-5' RNA ligase family protein [Clostridium felsineum]
MIVNSNIKRRTIMIFPEFSNMQVIDKIREKYDPLFKHVRGHVTLAFTFKSNLTQSEIEEHIKRVCVEFRSFKLSLQGILKVDNEFGRYLFLEVRQGRKTIKELSCRLYTGILESYKPEWFSDEKLLPHMTIGQFKNKNEIDRAFEEVQDIKDKFTTTVNKISVEIVDENEDSIIEFDVTLQD